MIFSLCRSRALVSGFLPNGKGAFIKFQLCFYIHHHLKVEIVDVFSPRRNILQTWATRNVLDNRSISEAGKRRVSKDNRYLIKL